MKRLVVMIGRIGSVLTAIGLALLLVSIVPYESGVQTFQVGPIPMAPESWREYSYPLVSPMQVLHLNLGTNGTMGLFMIACVNLIGWISDHNLTAVAHPPNPFNSTVLSAYVAANPNSVVFSQLGASKVDFAYSPSKLLAITVALSNPGNDVPSFEYRSTITNQAVPSVRAGLGATWLLSGGLVAVSPWLLISWRDKLSKEKKERMRREEKRNVEHGYAAV